MNAVWHWIAFFETCNLEYAHVIEVKWRPVPVSEAGTRQTQNLERGHQSSGLEPFAHKMPWYRVVIKLERDSSQTKGVSISARVVDDAWADTASWTARVPQPPQYVPPRNPRAFHSQSRCHVASPPNSIGLGPPILCRRLGKDQPIDPAKAQTLRPNSVWDSPCSAWCYRKPDTRPIARISTPSISLFSTRPNEIADDTYRTPQTPNICLGAPFIVKESFWGPENERTTYLRLLTNRMWWSKVDNLELTASLFSGDRG